MCAVAFDISAPDNLIELKITTGVFLPFLDTCGITFNISTYIFISEIEDDIVIMAGISNKTTFEECNVENGRIEIDKLEDEYFERQIIIKLGLCTMHFCKNKMLMIDINGWSMQTKWK